MVDASPNAPNIDVLVDGKMVVTNAAYESASNYLTFQSGTRRVEVRVAGTTTPDLIDTKPSLYGHKDYTFLPANFVANITPVVLTDDHSAPSSRQIKVRLNQPSPTRAAAELFLV